MSTSAKFQDAESEYAKDKELRQEDVRALQQWMAKQPHLPKISDFKVILFLQSCYYRLEPAKTAIENYFTVRAHCPEFFTNHKSKPLQDNVKLSLAHVLVQPSVKGYTVMFAKLMDSSTDLYNFHEQAKMFDMAVSFYYAQKGTSLGQMLVVDMEGSSFSHLTKLNVSSVKKYLFYLQEALPVRIKGVHIINVSALSYKFIELAKPFLSKELVDMLVLHKSLDALFEYVPKEALPNEYGGKAGTCKELHEKQIENFKTNAKFFEEEEKLVTDEAKRQGKPKNVNDIFGIEGTFKKLDID